MSFPRVESLITNAIDFLEAATADLEERPKHSVISFYAAVELFLKARLMHEHWTLVVAQNPDATSFKKGDFVSVSFSEACARLQKVVGSPVPDKARQIFDTLRRHRNRMVHFYHEGEIRGSAVETIALEQLIAWNALSSLIRDQWKDLFAGIRMDLDRIDRGFRGHRKYLEARYESLKDKLDELRRQGNDIVACRVCQYDAANQEQEATAVYSAHCLVCRSLRSWIELECVNCEGVMTNEGDDGAVCPRCDTRYAVEELVEHYNEQILTKDNYFCAETPANCSFCDGYHSVIEWKECYLCMSCIAVTEDLSQCDWCGESNNGDMSLSNLTGCSECEGSAPR